MTVNLGMLATFKYFNFFTESADALLGSIGVATDWPTLNVVLTVGISFYTFQTMSDTVDVYRRRIEPTNDLMAFAVFVAFFPQVVAGPIERARRLLPQFEARRRVASGPDLRSALSGSRSARGCVTRSFEAFGESLPEPASVSIGQVYGAVEPASREPSVRWRQRPTAPAKALNSPSKAT